MSYQTLIDVPALRRWLQDAPTTKSGLALIDCRFDLAKPEAGRTLYLSGHIPGARFADLNQDLSAPVTQDSGRHPLPQPLKFATTLARLGIDEGVQVVAYDAANGAFAARLWWMLRAWGHLEVAVLDGGYPAWTAAGAPTVAGDQPTAPGNVVRPPRIAAWPVVSATEVADLAGDARRLLVDARAAERYAGSVEPIDPVAGHVPGALNHPFSSNLGSDGRFLSAAELKRRWQSRLGDREAAQLVAMCGSGVTACHNLLALEIAGLPGAKLYAGSWSEWIRDPKRPIAKGDLARGA
jgi:thiosulfate/3-mercaptopyruvate sulfurtransferase